MCFIFGSGGSSSLHRLFSSGVRRLLIAVSSLAAEQGLWDVRASVVVAPLLWNTGPAVGLLASRRVGSSKTRDQTHVSWIGRQILYLWVTREALI